MSRGSDSKAGGEYSGKDFSLDSFDKSFYPDDPEARASLKLRNLKDCVADKIESYGLKLANSLLSHINDPTTTRDGFIAITEGLCKCIFYLNNLLKSISASGEEVEQHPTEDYQKLSNDQLKSYAYTLLRFIGDKPLKSLQRKCYSSVPSTTKDAISFLRPVKDVVVYCDDVIDQVMYILIESSGSCSASGSSSGFGSGSGGSGSGGSGLGSTRGSAK